MAKRANSLKEVQVLAEHIGDFAVHWGFKRVHGRIWTHLVVSSRPLDASDLIQRLGISKALASMSLGEMLRYDVIRDAGKSSRGTQLYQVNPNLLDIFLEVVRLREREMIGHIHRAINSVKKLPAQKQKQHQLNSENVDSLVRMMDGTVKALEVFMKNLHFDMSSLRTVELVSAQKTASRRRG